MAKNVVHTKKIPSMQGTNIKESLLQIEKRKMNENLRVKDDTIIRIELQGKIAQGIADGKSNIEIINELSKNERYVKFKKYFEIWIENKRKVKKTNGLEKIEKIIT